jgi:hypothetical protein
MLTNKDLLSAIPAFQRINGATFKPRNLYKLNRFMRKINECLEIYNATRKKTEKENLTELLNTEIDVEKITLNILPDENCSLSNGDIMAVEKFIEFNFEVCEEL